MSNYPNVALSEKATEHCLNTIRNFQEVYHSIEDGYAYVIGLVEDLPKTNYVYDSEGKIDVEKTLWKQAGEYGDSEGDAAMFKKMEEIQEKETPKPLDNPEPM